MKSFFDKGYQTPLWFIDKHSAQNNEKSNEDKNSRRRFLKSAAGATAIAAFPSVSLSAKQQAQAHEQLTQLKQSDPWLTLDATLSHLLPASDLASTSSPSATDLNALEYLYQVMTVQPTDQDEKEFILKGVGWLNGYSETEKDKPFVQLSVTEKEVILRGISHSRAGSNWLSTLLSYLFEAMLAPPAYGGNPEGLGWQWLEHQGGFPLPKVGQRYFELPTRGLAKNKIAIREIDSRKPGQHLAKLSPLKRTKKA